MFKQNTPKFSMSKTLQILALTIPLAMSCAHDVKKASLSESAVPQEEIQKTQARMNSARQQQVDVIAPKSFAKAEDHLADARKSSEKNKSSQKIKDDVEWANAYLDRAEQIASESASAIAPVLTARQAAVDSKAPTINPKEFAAADRRLRNLTGDWAPGKVKASTQDLSELQAQYLNAQLNAIKTAYLTEAQNSIKNSEEMGAKKYAPQTLAEAKMALTTAERTIDTDRNNTALVEQSSRAALAQARKLAQIVSFSKSAKKGSSEAAALAMYNRSSQLANTENQLQQSERTSASLESQLEQQRADAESENSRMNMAIADLRTQNSDLENQNQDLSSKEKFNAALAKAQSQFSPNEADVYRQGDNLIVRLKSVNFGTSKAELPASGAASLSKVKEIIAELDAEKVTIEGHTDSTGSAAVNKDISQKRADAVKNYLVNEGAVAANQVESVGMGYEKPITSNKTSEGRKQNRRVDVVITPSTTSL